MLFYTMRNIGHLYLIIQVIMLSNTHCGYRESAVTDCPVDCRCNKRTSKFDTDNHMDTHFIEVECRGQYWTKIPMLPKGNVTKLHISSPETKKGIGITSLPDYVFEQNRGVHLQDISLRGTYITDIGLQTFKNLEKLQRFRISRKLTHLTSGIFKNAPRLMTLNLKDNLFKQIPESAICDAIALRELFLAKNKITKLHFGPCFVKLDQLSSCSLEGNPVKEINPGDLAVLRMCQGVSQRAIY